MTASGPLERLAAALTATRRRRDDPVTTDAGFAADVDPDATVASGVTLAAPMASRSVAGQRIGPYALVREIGRGGMGVVYLARRVDGQYDRDVALKLLRTAALRRAPPRALSRRAAVPRDAVASAHRAHVRRRRHGGGTAVLHDGVRRRRPPRSLLRRAAREHSRTHPAVPPGLRRRVGGAPQPRRAPRHQTEQRARDARRHDEAARLRHRDGARSPTRVEAYGRRRTADAFAAVHASLRQSRTDPRRHGDGGVRRLFARRGALRTADRIETAASRRWRATDAHGNDAATARAPARSVAISMRSCRRRCTRSRRGGMRRSICCATIWSVISRSGRCRRILAACSIARASSSRGIAWRWRRAC